MSFETDPRRSSRVPGGTGSAASEMPAQQRGRRGSRPFADLTTGSIPRHLTRLAWPQVIEQVLNVADQMVDMVWAGRLPGGFRAIAGLGVAQTFTNLGFTSRQGLEQSTRAMVSQAVGAGNLALANHVAIQSFILMGAYSAVMALVGLFLTDVLFRIIGASSAVTAEAATYMRIQFIGMMSMAFRMSSSSILQASGDVLLPLRATTVTRVIHIALSPVLMFGWVGFPALGLAGASLANVFAQSVGAGINLYALFRGSSRLRLTLHGLRIDRQVMWRLVKIGAPASATGLERSVAQTVLLRIVSPFGDVAMAAYGLTRRLEMFANFGGMGIGNATGIMVGQNLGARKPERAKRAVAWGVLFGTVMKATVGIPLVFFPVFVIGIFTRQADVIALTSIWLQLLALQAIFMASGMVFQQAFNVAGDTVTVMWVTFVSVVVMELPLAWLLVYPLGIGPLGIAWANVAGMLARMVLFIPIYFSGSWLKRKVL